MPCRAALDTQKDNIFWKIVTIVTARQRQRTSCQTLSYSQHLQLPGLSAGMYDRLLKAPLIWSYF